MHAQELKAGKFIRWAFASVVLVGAQAAAYERAPRLDDGWPIGDATELGWNVARLDELASKIADSTFKSITSVIVSHRGALVYEAYFNDGNRERLNDTRSATKSITSLLVGAAIDRGFVPGVEAKVYDYFPDKRSWAYPDSRKRAFTLEDLLTMSSLWECNDANQFSRGNEERMYVMEDWVQFALDLPIKGFSPWNPTPQDSPFGRAFSYCSAGVFVLGAIVERATELRLDRFARVALEAPLGIHDVQWNLSPLGIGIGAGGTRYRSRDLAKIAEMVRQGGRWQGRQVISKRWVDASLTNRAQVREGVEYGYLWWHFHFTAHGRDRDVWGASGNGGNRILIMPDEELVTVITSTAYNKPFMHPQSDAIYRDFVLEALPSGRAARP